MEELQIMMPPPLPSLQGPSTANKEKGEQCWLLGKLGPTDICLLEAAKFSRDQEPLNLSELELLEERVGSQDDGANIPNVVSLQQVNYYEKEIELMRKNFEREKKDSKKSFEAEMSKVEGQKRDLEETVARYEAVIHGLKTQKCVQSLELEEELEIGQARVGTQFPKDVRCPRQQLHQEGEELRTQCRDREGLVLFSFFISVFL